MDITSMWRQEGLSATESIYSPISALDVARAVAVILDNPATHIGQIYDLTGPESADLDHYARIFSEALGSPSDIATSHSRRGAKAFGRRGTNRTAAPNGPLLPLHDSMLADLRLGSGVGAHVGYAGRTARKKTQRCRPASTLDEEDVRWALVPGVTDPALGLNGAGFHIFPAIKVNSTPEEDVFAFSAPLKMMLHPGASFYFSSVAAVSVSGYLVKFAGA
jgi:hypothetical protein